MFAFNTHIDCTWELIIISFIPPISKDFFRTLIYAAPCEWNELSNILERQIMIVSGRVLKQCYLHNNMDADCKQQRSYCSYYSYFCFDH